MKNRIVRFGVCLILLGGLNAAWSAGLGVATANGDFKVDQATVRGNATLFDGSVVETGKIPSRLRLTAGPRIELRANSRATIHPDRLVLNSGSSDLALAGGYQVEAGELRIAPAAPNSAARVAREGDKAVQVAALRGALKIFNARGLQIANVFPGTALAFEPQAGGAAPPSTFLGCLLKKEGKFIIYDQTTRLIIELRGNQDFNAEWGNRVQVIGTTDTSAESEIAAQIVDVTSLTRFGQGGCEPVASVIAAELPSGAPASPGAPAEAPAAPGAAPAPASTPAPTPAPTPSGGGGGMSAGTKVAIIAAIGGGGAAAAIVLSSSGNDRSRD